MYSFAQLCNRTGTILLLARSPCGFQEMDAAEAEELLADRAVAPISFQCSSFSNFHFCELRSADFLGTPQNYRTIQKSDIEVTKLKTILREILMKF